MSVPETPAAMHDTQPRVCPNCGGKVSSRAKTCLICGADLIALAPAEAPAAPKAPVRPKLTLRNILIQVMLTIAGLALLAGIVWGFMTVVRRARPSRPTLTPTSASTPTLAPTPAPTGTPTLTPPVPDASSTPIPPRQHKVQAGETLLRIASLYDVSVEDIQRLNDLGDSEIIQVGQVLLIPPPGATAVPPTPLPTGPTPGTMIYVVQPGETLLGIAQRVGVPMAVIQQINGIDNPEELQAGQHLIIPTGPTATATHGPTPTPTPLAKYSPPPLLSPLDGAKFEGAETPILLHWAATTLLRPNEWYLVTIERPGSGQPPVTFRTKTTAQAVPIELYPGAREGQRMFTWRVGVVRQSSSQSNGQPVFEEASLPGETRSFVWRQPPATPTPTPGPT